MTRSGTMWQYSEYLAISEDFIPVFSEHVDKNYKEGWKSFIPHNYMRDMLEKFIIALERAHGGDKRSLWLTGSYGTGKTFTCFVLKHLLEDSLDDVEDYFKKHQNISIFWPRFRALRENKKYLVVYRSGSGHITSSRRLVMELQQAIKEQLKVQGYTHTFGESIMEQMVGKLTDPNNIFNWEGAFNKYKNRFNTFRTAASAEEIIERLRAGDIRTGEHVAAVFEEEGLALLDSPSDIKTWIKEIIVGNDINGLVFIWDEFTEYFSHNVAVTPLQELAQATADMPFYLFLVTHRALSQFSRIDDETRRKLLDRFHNCQLEMTPVTAYKLIANVIETKAGLHDKWEIRRDSLWSKVDVAVLHINVLGEEVPKEELKMLVPLHPYTAYLLSTISSLYSSSQRTLFQFLKKAEPGSFPWFIEYYPKDNWYWLTPDYLWQYFFEDIKIESIDTVSDILSHFHSNKDSLQDEDEMRVFRIMLLLTALWRQTQGASFLLKPRLSVIKRMFVGTDLYNRVSEVADRLCASEIMLAVPTGSDYEYLVPTSTIDYSKLQQYQQRVKDVLSFDKMINVDNSTAEFAPDLLYMLFLQGAAKLRHPVQIVSAKELKLRRERLFRVTEKPYEVGVLLVVAQEDEHLHETEDVAAELSKTFEKYCILISQAAFGSKRWRDWLDYRARSWYHEEMRDSNTKRYYDSKAKGIVDEWITAVRSSRFRAYFRNRQEELAGCDSIAAYLEDIVASVFPYGPEKLMKIATLYSGSYGKAGAEIGLNVARTIQRPYKDVVEALKNQGVWENELPTHYIEHPLNKMKNVVDSIFASQEHVVLKELWEALQEPPYGLMPSPIGILLFAFLLRDYAEGYYYSDGVNSLPLNPNKLAEIVEKVMKNARLSENYTIRRMSVHGELFCKMAREVFHLADEQAAYPEEARKYMRKIVMNLGYPLWALAYYVQETSGMSVVEEIQHATEKINEILAYDREELNNDDMKEVVAAIHPVRHELSRLLSKDRLKEGMKQFFKTYEPEMINLMDYLNLDVNKVMDRLRLLLKEDVYLWHENGIKEKLPGIVKELDLIDALNILIQTKKQDLSELREHFHTSWFKSKLPLFCFKEGQPPEVANVIDYLYSIFYTQGTSFERNLNRAIRIKNNDLVSLLRSGTILLGILVEKYTGQKLSEPETKELYEELPDISNMSSDEVRHIIVHTLSQQSKQKKINNLKHRWQELTLSESPEKWSEDRRTPIHWVLESEDHYDFLEQFEKIRSLPEQEIDNMIDYLEKHVKELSVLLNNEYVLNKFIEVAAGDYADIVRKTDQAEKLQEYIYQALNVSVHQWPMRLNEINKLVREWVTENYKATVYPQILEVIESISPDDIKKFVKHLVAEDARVGARLLTSINEKKKQYK